MDEAVARRLAEHVIRYVQVDDPEMVADTTVLWKHTDGTYSVCDNGESVECQTAEHAIQIMVENLTA